MALDPVHNLGQAEGTVSQTESGYHQITAHPKL